MIKLCVAVFFLNIKITSFLLNPINSYQYVFYNTPKTKRCQQLYYLFLLTRFVISDTILIIVFYSFVRERRESS